MNNEIEQLIQDNRQLAIDKKNKRDEIEKRNNDRLLAKFIDTANKNKITLEDDIMNEMIENFLRREYASFDGPIADITYDIWTVDPAICEEGQISQSFKKGYKLYLKSGGNKTILFFHDKSFKEDEYQPVILDKEKFSKLGITVFNNTSLSLSFGDARVLTNNAREGKIDNLNPEIIEKLKVAAEIIEKRDELRLPFLKRCKDNINNLYRQICIKLLEQYKQKRDISSSKYFEVELNYLRYDTKGIENFVDNNELEEFKTIVETHSLPSYMDIIYVEYETKPGKIVYIPIIESDIHDLFTYCNVMVSHGKLRVYIVEKSLEDILINYSPKGKQR